MLVVGVVAALPRARRRALRRQSVLLDAMLQGWSLAAVKRSVQLRARWAQGGPSGGVRAQLVRSGSA